MINPGGRSQSTMLPGVSIPSLKVENNNNIENDNNETNQRSATEKHIEIVEYLRRLPADVKASFLDIQRGFCIA